MLVLRESLGETSHLKCQSEVVSVSVPSWQEKVKLHWAYAYAEGSIKSEWDRLMSMLTNMSLGGGEEADTQNLQSLQDAVAKVRAWSSTLRPGATEPMERAIWMALKPRCDRAASEEPSAAFAGWGLMLKTMRDAEACFKNAEVMGEVEESSKALGALVGSRAKAAAQKVLDESLEDAIQTIEKDGPDLIFSSGHI